MSGLTAGTIASPTYHGHVRVMAESFLEQHPGSRVTIVDLGLAGHGAERTLPPSELKDGIEVLDPRALFDDDDELDRLGLAYSTQGLAGALKPRILRHLLDRDEGPVALIDSDIFVLAPLDDLGERAEREGALLTTHMITPHLGAERPTLLAGTFNSGFLVVGPPGRELLEWWCERTARECIFRPSSGMVWEQSWLGLAHAFFGAGVLRDAGVNAMSRELLDSDVEWRDDVPYLSGRPLRAMHFSGPYDPEEPGFLLSQAEEGADVVRRPGPLPGSEFSWLSLERKPGAARVSERYAERLLAAGSPECRVAHPPYWRLREGLPVHAAVRSAYREGLVAAESGEPGAEPPPNPFLGDEVEDLLEWLEGAPEGGPADGRLNRFLVGAWRAHYAETLFPRVPGADADAFLAWLDRRLGERPGGIPPRLLGHGGGGSRRLRIRGGRR